jgi:hypothetical protein
VLFRSHFNYRYKLPDKEDLDSLIKGWWVETSEQEAKEFFTYQLISGDRGDNIITPFPENCGLSNKHLTMDLVLKGYIEGLSYTTPSGLNKNASGLGVTLGMESFYTTYKLIKLLSKEQDYNLNNLEVPPSITELIIEVPESTTYEIPPIF